MAAEERLVRRTVPKGLLVGAAPVPIEVRQAVGRAVLVLVLRRVSSCAAVPDAAKKTPIAPEKRRR